MTVVIGVVIPGGDQGIHQHILHKLVLIKTIDTDVSKKGRLAAGCVGSVTVAFANKSPVVYGAIVGVDVSGVVAESIGLACTDTICAIGVGTVAIFLAGIFIVVGKIIVPHAAN